MIDDVQKITEQLASFPVEIYHATTVTEKLREAWLLIEARKDYESAGAFLEAKAENLTEGQAKARAVEKVYGTTMEVIKAESSFRRALADQTRLENEFTSIRKRANLVEATIQRLGREAA